MFNNRKGLTLIEVILVLALIGITIPAIYSIFFAGNTSYGVSKNRGFAQQDVRLASDFIASNLKYVTALSDDENEFYTDYYSLKVIQDDDIHVLALIHNIRDDKGTETLEDDTIEEEIIKQITGVWDSITISYTEEDRVIKLNITKTEGSGNTRSNFELPIDTQMVNSDNLSTNILLDLYDGEAVYFRDAKNQISNKSIYITDSNEAEDEDTVIVNYYDNNILYRSDYVSKGITITLAGMENELFKGWSKNKDLSGDLHVQGSILIISEDTNLYAVWEEEDTGPGTGTGIPSIHSINISHDGVLRGPNSKKSRFVIDMGKDYSTNLVIKGEYLQELKVHLSITGDGSNLEHSLIFTDEEINIEAKFKADSGNKKNITLKVVINQDMEDEESYSFYFVTTN